jgi:hypothetical protein
MLAALPADWLCSASGTNSAGLAVLVATWCLVGGDSSIGVILPAWLTLIYVPQCVAGLVCGSFAEALQKQSVIGDTGGWSWQRPNRLCLYLSVHNPRAFDAERQHAYSRCMAHNKVLHLPGVVCIQKTIDSF